MTNLLDIMLYLIGNKVIMKSLQLRGEWVLSNSSLSRTHSSLDLNTTFFISELHLTWFPSLETNGSIREPCLLPNLREPILRCSCSFWEHQHWLSSSQETKLSDKAGQGWAGNLSSSLLSLTHSFFKHLIFPHLYSWSFSLDPALLC